MFPDIQHGWSLDVLVHRIDFPAALKPRENLPGKGGCRLQFLARVPNAHIASQHPRTVDAYRSKMNQKSIAQVLKRPTDSTS